MKEWCAAMIGAWMRIYDLDGTEQSALLALGDHMFYLHSHRDNAPMTGEYTYERGSNRQNAKDVAAIAQKLRARYEVAHARAEPRRRDSDGAATRWSD